MSSRPATGSRVSLERNASRWKSIGSVESTCSRKPPSCASRCRSGRLASSPTANTTVCGGCADFFHSNVYRAASFAGRMVSPRSEPPSVKRMTEVPAEPDCASAASSAFRTSVPPRSLLASDKLERLLYLLRCCGGWLRLERKHLLVEQQNVETIGCLEAAERSFQCRVAAFQLFPLHGKGVIEKEDKGTRRAR